MPTSPCALVLLVARAAVAVVRGEPHPDSSVNASSSWLPSPFGRTKRRFTQDKLIDAGDLNLAAGGGPIAAWLDWNRDQHVDLVRLSADQRSLAVHLWDSAQFQYDTDAAARVDSDLKVIKSVVPGDYNFDGKIDLLVLGSLKGGGGGGWWGGGDDDDEDRTEMRIHLQQPDGSIGPAIPIDDAASLAHPIPFDGTGDMRTDLIGFSSSSHTSAAASGEGGLRMWRNVYDPANKNNNGNETSSSSLFSLVDAPLDYSSHPSGQFTCQFPSPHFNAFVDLDGDCLADLFFVCLGGGGHDPERLEYQVWTNSKGGKFVFKREGKLPRGTKSVTFGDMDRDGTIDLVVTSCPKSSHQRDCQISILYNRQIPLCDPSSSSSSAGACRDPEALCTADPDFAFTTAADEDDETTIIRVEDLAPSGGGHDTKQRRRQRRRLITQSEAGFKGSFPLLASVGDFNIDGYPDLLIVTADEHDPKDKRAQILESVPCPGGGAGMGSDVGGAIVGCGGGGGGGGGGAARHGDKRRRGFRLVTSGAEALEQIHDVESAHWVDVDDDGTLDILVQRSGGGGGSRSGAARQPVFIKNNYFHDAFFLKAQVLNGACQGWCEPRPGTDEQRYRPFGSSYSGASFKFTVLDPTGARRSTQFAQLPQSSYMSLSTPYAYCGLGRTNNYVENLFVGSTRDQPQHFINVEGIIPNSQVLINPYQPEGVDEPSGWTKTLYLRPGDWIPWVTVVLLAAILGLGIVVIVLHVREKREDEAERRARLLSLNFQAL